MKEQNKTHTHKVWSDVNVQWYGCHTFIWGVMMRSNSVPKWWFSTITKPSRHDDGGPHPPPCVIHSSQLCDVEIYLNFIYLYILYTSSAISIFNQRNASMWLFRQTKDCFLQNDFVLGHFCTACCFVEMTKVLRTLLKSVKVLRKLWKSIKVLVTLLQGLKPLNSIKT